MAMAAILLGVVDLSDRPDDRRRGVAREAEARGFESLGSPSTPTSRLAAHNLARRRPLPDHYRRTLDPFVALTAAAAVTTNS